MREVTLAATRKETFFYSDAWVQIASETKIRVELYQMLFEILDPRWSSSMVKLDGSMDLELFFQSWSSAKQDCSLHSEGPFFQCADFRV